MTLIDIALLYEMEAQKNDVSPYDKAIERLSADIDNALGINKK